MRTFRADGPNKRLKEYLALLAEYPELHANREHLKLVTSEEELFKYSEQNHEAIGILMQSPFGALLVDLVEEGGHRFPYMRFISPTIHDGPTGVVVFATTVEGKVPFIRTFRHATGKFHLELPRGYIDLEENPLAAAVRELEEEAGFTGKPTFLGCTHTDTGLSPAAVAFVHIEVTESSQVEHENTEAITEVIELSHKEIESLICSGSLHDGFTLQALTFYRLSPLSNSNALEP